MKNTISNKFQIVTIDGESACGKSSIGEILSAELCYFHIDSGMLFRAIAFAIEIRKLDILQTDDRILKQMFEKDLKFEGTNVSYKDINISEHIHLEETGLLATELGKYEKIQNWFINYQKDLATQIKANGFSGLVVSGRIGGSIIFPDADKKFYLAASLFVKATRRYEQLIKLTKGTIDFEIVKNSIVKRDNIKNIISYREISIPADTVTIDTTNLNLENLFQQIYPLCLEVK